jgi:predicted hydrocarbon binding protein
MSAAPSPEPQISGILIAARFEFLRQVPGSDVVRRVIDALPGEERARLVGVERNALYPFATLIVLDRTIAALVPEGDAVYETLGEYSARLRNEWLGEHNSLVSPHAYLSRLAEDHGRLQSFGQASYRRIGFGEGEIAYREYPQVDPIFCRSGRAFLRASLEQLVGKGGVSVVETRCQCRGDDACVYALKWSARE